MHLQKLYYYVGLWEFLFIPSAVLFPSIWVLGAFTMLRAHQGLWFVYSLAPRWWLSTSSENHHDEKIKNHNWLVVWNMFFSHILGRLIPNIFQRGWNHQPDNFEPLFGGHFVVERRLRPLFIHIADWRPAFCSEKYRVHYSMAGSNPAALNDRDWHIRKQWVIPQSK